MKATEYVDIAEEINRCLERAKHELTKVKSALLEYNLDYGTDMELHAITEAIDLCKVSEDLDYYEDDEEFQDKFIC